MDSFGVDRCRTTVHNWARKYHLQPGDGKSPTLVAVDETVIQSNTERYWLVAAVEPATNGFLRELPEKHDVLKSGALAQPIRTVEPF